MTLYIYLFIVIFLLRHALFTDLKRKKMNTLNRSMLTGFTFALMAFAGISQAQTNDNWSSSTGSVRAGSDPSLCWRDNFWTPALK